jgi:hypothetical protein
MSSCEVKPINMILPTDHTDPATHGKSAVPAGTTIDGRFSFASGLTYPGVGIFTDGPYYISIPRAGVLQHWIGDRYI